MGNYKKFGGGKVKEKEPKITIKPYGKFKVVKVKEPSLKNCKKCWFDKAGNHCPEGYNCVIEKDGKKQAVVFVKEEK